MYQGSPQDVTLHLSRMGRKVPKEENSIEYLIDVIQKYDQSEHGVEALAQFVLTGVRPPKLSNEDMSASTIVPTPPQPRGNRLQSEGSSKRRNYGKRLPLQTSTDEPNEFDHSFFIFTVCLFFFSSNDAVPAFIQERFIFVRETSHNAYRASSYTIAGLITYLPLLALQSAVYAAIVWKALKLRGPFYYFLFVL